MSAVVNESPGLKMPGVVSTLEVAMPAFVPVITIRPTSVIVWLVVVTFIGRWSVVVGSIVVTIIA